jgi:hypothetical protein
MEENSERILDQEITGIKAAITGATGNLVKRDIDSATERLVIFKENTSRNSLKKNNKISLQPWQIMAPGFFNLIYKSSDGII